MEKYAIFHLEGGLGKHIAATEIAKSIIENHPDRKLVVVCHYIEIFINIPGVWRVYRIGQTPYFWENYIKDGNSIIFKHEPYFTTEHINGKLSLIDNWAKLYGLKSKNLKPELKFNNVQEGFFSAKWIRQKPIFLIQTNGGPLTEQPNLYSWTRDMPYDLAQTIVDQYKRDYHVIQICRNDFNALKDVEIQNKPLSNMELLYLVKMSQKRLLIDSCLQHAAAALNLPSVVLWVATNPELFGYNIHKNLVANISNQIPLPDSYLFDYNFQGQLWESPIATGEKIFDVTEVMSLLNEV